MDASHEAAQRDALGTAPARIQQLRRACLFIDEQTPENARLALILLDNLAEVAMYERVSHLFAADGPVGSFGARYPAAKRSKVLQDFSEKVSFLASDGTIIDTDDADILRVGHLLRNETYHRGILRDDMVLPLVQTYSHAVCRLLPRILGLGLVPISDEVRGFLAEHGVTKDVLHQYSSPEVARREPPWGADAELDPTALAAVVAQYAKRIPCNTTALCEALASHISHRLDRLVENLNYVASNLAEGLELAAMLKLIQFNEWFSRDYWFPYTEEGRRDYEKARNALCPTYRAPVTIQRISQWSVRSDALRAETKPGRTLQKFRSLDNEMEHIEQLVENAVSEIEYRANAE